MRAGALELLEGPALAVGEEGLNLGEPLVVEVGQARLGPPAGLSFRGFGGNGGQRCRCEQQRPGRVKAAASALPLKRADRPLLR